MEQLTAVGRWKLDKTLGQGSYGVVKRANHAHTHAQAAIKIVDTTKLKKPSERVALRREVSVHYTLKHQNVVEVLEVFERSGYIFIVMELLEGGDLFNYIVEHGKLEEDRARHLFIQMLNALWYCHANSVVHRDLKLENFLIDKEATTVKLTDFGFCNIMSKDRLLETFCGSPYYCAPEIFLAQKYEGKSADIWSLGVILYAILTGSLPFVNPQGKVMFDKLMVAECPYPTHLSENSKSLIKKMLQPTPANRAPITELLTHPWLSGPIPASVPTRPRTSSLFTPPTCTPSPKEAYHSVAETRPRRGQQNNKNNRKSVVGTWKRVTDMLALQFFSKKDDKDKDKDRKDSCSADDWVPMSPTITSIATNTSSTNSSSSANSSTGSSTSAGSAGAIKATVRAC